MNSLFRAILLLVTISFSVAVHARNNKYFHEPAEDDHHRHYDTRFFHDLVSDEERQITLTSLIKAYLLLFENLGLETWIAHGTLLGWWWNQKILPWDWDLDTQVANSTLQLLAQNHNHTYHEYHSSHSSIRRKYLLDINPWSWERVRGDGDNIIDARFIDISNGMFLDITGLAPTDPTNADIVMCKNDHRYNISDIFPLREAQFEGVRAKVPYAYTRILMDEYSDRSLRDTVFHNHTFDAEQWEWQKVDQIRLELEEVAPSGGAFSK